MHMTDFASSKKEFSTWRGQSERRKRFVSDLVECIRVNTNKGFAHSLLLSEYDRVNSEFQLAELAGAPFVIATALCLGSLKMWAAKKQVKPKDMLVLIEQGDDDQAQLIQKARSMDGLKVVALNKENAQAFQAGISSPGKCELSLIPVGLVP